MFWILGTNLVSWTICSFTKKNFAGSIGAGSDTAKIFVYKTADTKAATIASGYFNDLANILQVWDFINAVTDTGTTARAYALFVATNNGTIVTTDFVDVV